MTENEHAGPHREGCPLRDGGGLAAAVEADRAQIAARIRRYAADYYDDGQAEGFEVAAKIAEGWLLPPPSHASQGGPSKSAVEALSDVERKVQDEPGRGAGLFYVRKRRVLDIIRAALAAADQPSDPPTGGECRICGGSDGKHDGAAHDAYVADRPAGTFPPTGGTGAGGLAEGGGIA